MKCVYYEERRTYNLVDKTVNSMVNGHWDSFSLQLFYTLLHSSSLSYKYSHIILM